MRSALAQAGVDSGIDIEVIVATDGEQTETRRRIESLADPRVRLVPARNSGRSATRNAGIAAATAPFLAFLDDDDRLLPGGIAARLDALERYPEAVLAYGRPVTMDADGREVVGSRARAARGREGLRDGLAEQMRGRSFFPSTVLVRREAIEKAGTFDEDLATGEDWLFFLRLSRLGPFVFVPVSTVLYRRHAGQVRSDPVSMEAALPVWTSRWFDDPKTPPEAKAQRDRLVGRHLAWIARNYRRIGDRERASACLRRAVRFSPRLLLHPRRAAIWLGAVLSGRGRG